MVNAWIPLVEALSVLSLTCFLVYKYADTKRTNWFSLVITAISWFLAFSMIFFIPLDIYSVSGVRQTASTDTLFSYQTDS